MEDDSAHNQTLSETAYYILILKRKEWGFNISSYFSPQLRNL